ncbi:DNA-deoxyinosine glycosylase [Collimonas sp. NPDC087041]|uniref:DNA-deoxyinosine glycosylase n=1 Tax=Collimonas sp. NPDC087041 TaxID=3363960 RepID=UPI003830944C
MTATAAQPVQPATSLTGFPPVIDASTRFLILGSFPGVASLSAQQYYGHPRNQFWALLSAVLDDDLVGLSYADRLACLRSHRIGLWDVIAGCERIGSLDSAIRNAQANQFDLLRQHCPQLVRVCFNGKTSGKFAPQFAAAGYDTLVLPSSSPANAQTTFTQKLQLWRGIIA